MRCDPDSPLCHTPPPPVRIRPVGRPEDAARNARLLRRASNAWDIARFALIGVGLLVGVLWTPLLSPAMAVFLGATMEGHLSCLAYGKDPWLLLTWYYEGRLDDADSPRFAKELARFGPESAVKAAVLKIVTSLAWGLTVAAGFLCGCEHAFNSGNPNYAPSPAWAWFALPGVVVALWAAAACVLVRRLRF